VRYLLLPPHRRLAPYIADYRGATSIEYCMIGALISIVILVGAQLIGVNISADFRTLASGFP
jgi:pilus assembly protein Flp/PilA